MKRHPALEQLSRDHHRALVVAARLKRASATDAEQVRQSFLDYWEAEGRLHFREEEEILLPTLARFASPEEPIVARVLIDHVRIRAAAAELAGGVDLPALRGLGTELEQHVRRQERQLFPLIEQALPEPELIALAARLAPER
jgi:iron-sulfur cluster repair protein YtfE (RIC family)